MGKMSKKSTVAIITILLIILVWILFLFWKRYENEKINKTPENKNFLIHRDPNEIVTLGGFYSGNDKIVLFKSITIQEADPASFVYINESYSKDKNNVYFEDTKIEGADPSTFGCIDFFYCMDKNSIYFKDQKIEGADAITFKTIGGYYGKDKNAIFYENNKLLEADPKTFQRTSNGSDFFQDKNHYFRFGEISSRKEFLFFERGDLVQGVKNIGFNYITYKNIIYFHDLGCQSPDANIEVKGADLETFQPLGENYAKDKNNVYFMQYVLENSNPASFKVLSENFAKDDKNVYFRNDIIPDLNPRNFEAIDNSNWRRKPKGYYPYELIKNQCLFGMLEFSMGEFFQDGINVYAGEKKIEEADPSTFIPLEFGFSKDENNVYYWNEKVSGADPATFVVLDRGLQITGADFIRPAIAKDKNNIYQGKNIIQGADPKTFQIIDSNKAKDRNGYYEYDFDDGIMKLK